MTQIGTTLTGFLIAEQRQVAGARGSFTALVADIAVACKKIASLVRRGALAGVLGEADQHNVQGELQATLDVLSNDVMLEALGRNGHVAALASEELDDIWLPPVGVPRGDYLVAFDPLDGSSNIRNNLSIGTIFSILHAPPDAREPTADDFLCAGTEHVAAGYCLYGPATVLTLTTGRGVHQFTLDPEIGEFLLTRSNVKIAPEAVEFAINMSRMRHWEPPVQRYVKECLLGGDGPRGRDFNMRWIASLVAEVHRILSRGGVFSYPIDDLLVQAGKAGRLRLLYELLPMAFIVEQAGGAASDGAVRLLSVAPASLHARSAVFLGARDEIERIDRYHREAMDA
jgi:fructose-1,6-bisphosphatase I